MALARRAVDPASRIERLITGQERRIQSVFRQALTIIRDQTTLDVLADLLQQGRIEDALTELIAAAELIGNTYGASLTAAAEDTARFLSAGVLTVNVAFNVSNERAVAAINRNRLRLITGFDAEMRAAVRAALADGIARGLNPREQARLFRATLGLTEQQVQTVNRFRALLTARANDTPSRQALTRALRDGRFDRTIERAIRDGVPLTEVQIERMVDRYRERLVNFRAETIARTEALRSVHEGVREMYQQAIDAGQLLPEQLQRTWVTAGDARVRDSHDALNGQVRGIDETWQGDNGELRFPGDPAAPASETVQCRCVISTRLEP